jgi:hypothetical protein
MARAKSTAIAAQDLVACPLQMEQKSVKVWLELFLVTEAGSDHCHHA